MFKLLFVTILLSDFGTCFAGLENIKDVITDPVISRRCKALLKSRSEKISTRQRLNAMLLRNNKLVESAKPAQKSVKQRLKLNETQIKNNLRLTTLRIQSMEENIVRKGCPGITL